MKDLYFNRELSLLEFNKRVLAQAEDLDIPLLERVRFLCISCTNLDEFFEVRTRNAQETLAGESGNLPSVTGSKAAAVLGGVYL